MKRQVLQTNDMHTIGNWLDFNRHVLQVGPLIIKSLVYRKRFTTTEMEPK